MTTSVSITLAFCAVSAGPAPHNASLDAFAKRLAALEATITSSAARSAAALFLTTRRSRADGGEGGQLFQAITSELTKRGGHLRAASIESHAPEPAEKVCLLVQQGRILYYWARVLDSIPLPTRCFQPPRPSFRDQRVRDYVGHAADRFSWGLRTARAEKDISVCRLLAADLLCQVVVAGRKCPERHTPRMALADSTMFTFSIRGPGSGRSVAHIGPFRTSELSHMRPAPSFIESL